jgi:hypothetical protein
MADEVIPSFNAQLRALKKGESLAKAERFSIGDPDASNITDALSRMRRTINAAVSRIREATGSNFRVESGALITSDNEAIVAVVSVSRL